MTSRNGTLWFTTGPATVVNPYLIEHLDQPPGMIDGVKTIRVDEDSLVHLSGEFGGFRLYCLVSYPRAEIVPESVKRVSETSFASKIRLELIPGQVADHEVVLRSPLDPPWEVRAAESELFPDAFAFSSDNYGDQFYRCDLSFLSICAETCPKIPLRIEYIGIAKGEKRGAHNRLGDGHEKLQKILARQNQTPSTRATAIVLYRPSPLEPEVLPFPDVLETLEATMIQHFKPRPLNVKRLDFPKDSGKLSAKLKKVGVRHIVTTVEAPRFTTLCSKVVTAAEEHTIKVSLP